MKSTFHGLETARRAMMTQQYALHTTGHNIANANTPGYTRQRVNFTQTEPYPNVGMNRPMLPGHLGTGVKAGSIQRVREHFLDVQFRNENNKVGYYGTKYEALTRMEGILNEPSEQGLASLIDQFWGAMQDLNGDADDSGARAVARRRAEEIANTFQYLNSSLTTVQDDYKAEIDVTIKAANSLLEQLNNVNKQIRSAEPHGYVPNDLYDEQDRILDQLSQMIDIETKREKSSGQPNDVAEGAVSVFMKLPNGEKLQLVNAVDGEALKKFNEEIDYSQGAFDKLSFIDIDGIATADEGIAFDKLSRGELKALIEAFGYLSADGSIKGTYPEMLANLNEMALQFATEMNNIHSIGFTLNAVGEPSELGGAFFEFDPANAAATLKVHADIMGNLNKITAAGVNKDALTTSAREEYETLMKDSPKEYELIRQLLAADNSYRNQDIPKSFSGDGSNALLMSNAKDTLMNFNGQTATIKSFYQSVIGEMAVKTQEAGRMLGSSEGLRGNVEFQRQSVSNVSLDEEMTMMIQFQHAYNAAARNITMVDEMLDRIINGMGVVGR
ncbi:flagellar hook-associated protein FlgK [Alkalihalophilus pseudofirmus]|uniref:Flagellar hook-associated protein 1 n=1 Tax=Alkalihalophilus pseudofirmus TaxID=79885 RepID=A0AAJ2NPV0_ALKPS|nr:flagellar hook-associated protein FlgK [Alkalihalophilus pseudofirmus]MDV2886288.1 flagellar hook-associated protein FlgK [Alkalihalophilus pseudofirmus]